MAALYVLPLSGRPGWHPAAAAAAVLVTRPGINFSPPADLVANLFGLTETEARVFKPLAEGRPQSEIAASLGVAPSTVKTHILRIYEKTGVSTRAFSSLTVSVSRS